MTGARSHSQADTPGGIRAILFDWAGTTVDHGSRAPAEVFVEIFRRRGLAITTAEARGPMGKAKRDHIAAILAMPRVAEAWRSLEGRPPGESDIDRLYDDFLPLQREALTRHSDVIPGVPEVVAECRRRGIAIGSTTGYTRALMDVVAPLARAGGFAPDAIVCADDVPRGRPAPWMIFRAAERLGVFPMAAVAVVDDTVVGIEAGRNAGAPTIAVTRTGNSLGLSRDEVAALDPADLSARLEAASAEFRRAGADHVIESVADLLPVLDELAGGGRGVPSGAGLP
jgi:phosphonoacetaldehyde hydrolase